MSENSYNRQSFQNHYEKNIVPNVIPAPKKVFTPVEHADNYNGVLPFEHDAQPFKEKLEKISHEHKKSIEKKPLKRTKEIAKFGDYFKILETLKTENLLEDQIMRVKNEHDEKLQNADFLNEKDWEILTVLELFDKKTFDHSIGTFFVAKMKIENIPTLKERILNENITLEQFYRSCLFHDIGKIALPDFILNNTMNDEQWVHHFMELPQKTNALADNELTPDGEKIIYRDDILLERGIDIPSYINGNDLGEMTAYFEEKRIRAVKLVPIGTIFSPKQLALLENLKIPDNSKPIEEMTMMEIIQLHESQSQEILTKIGYPLEGMLAGNHHNYKHRDPRYEPAPKTLSSVSLSNATAENIKDAYLGGIVHLADIEEALEHDRSYHLKKHRLTMLAFIVDTVTNDDTVDPETAIGWIVNDLNKMSKGYLREIETLVSKHQHPKEIQQRNRELMYIYDFLYDHHAEGFVEYKFAA